jgi:hypothetical protein
MADKEYVFDYGGKRYKVRGPAGATQAELLEAAGVQEQGWFDKNGRTLMTTTGAGLGMIAVAPAAVGGTILSGGLATPGAIALEMGGAAGGGAIGSQAFDAIQTLRGRGRQGETVISKAKQVASDVGMNALGALGGRAIGNALEIGGRAAAPYVAPRVRAALDYLTAKGARGVKSLRGGTAASLERETAEAAAARTEALRRAEALKASAKADTARAAGFERKAAKATVKAQPPAPNVGQIKTLSERGAPVRDATVAARSKIYENQVAQDKVLRDAADLVVADNEAAGKFINDMPSAKGLFDEVSGRLKPDPATSPTATSLPTPEESKVLTAVQSALKDRTVELTPAEARAAVEAGFEVKRVPMGPQGDVPAQADQVRYVRTFKTSFEALDNLRRRLGESFNGVPTGFEGIPNHLARDMYGKVSRVLDDYVGSARAEVQANWKNGLQALEPFDNTRIGKTLTATQGETGIPAAAAAEIPGRIVAQGREGVEQVGALAGPETQKQFLRDQVQVALSKADGTPLPYDEAIAKVGPDTKLGDSLTADPELSRAVQQHLDRLRDAKLSGVQAEKFEGFGKARAKSAEQASKQETAALKEADKIERVGLEAAADLEQIKVAKPEEVLSKADSVARKLLVQGKITQEQYATVMGEIAETERAMGIEKARNRALLILGGSGLAAFGLNRTAEGLADQMARKVRAE